MTDETKPDFFLKTWLVAVRPFAYTASVSAVAVGLALVPFAGYSVRWALFFLTLTGVLCFHTGANLLNDCYDYRRGLDTEVLPTSGAVVRGLLTDRQAFRGGMVFMAAGTVIGLVLVYLVDLVVLALGLGGALIAFGYTRSGFCLKYASLGDAGIFFAFGLLPMFGTFWVQTQAFNWLPVIWSFPVVLFTVGILHANNWHDIESDRAKGCFTLAAVLGERRSGIYYRILMLGPFALTVLYLLAGFVPQVPALAPRAAAIVFVAFPVALKLFRCRRDTDEETFRMLDGKTAQLQLMFSVLLLIAFIAARYLPVLR